MNLLFPTQPNLIEARAKPRLANSDYQKRLSTFSLTRLKNELRIVENQLKKYNEEIERSKERKAQGKDTSIDGLKALNHVSRKSQCEMALSLIKRAIATKQQKVQQRKRNHKYGVRKRPRRHIASEELAFAPSKSAEAPKAPDKPTEHDDEQQTAKPTPKKPAKSASDKYAGKSLVGKKRAVLEEQRERVNKELEALRSKRDEIESAIAHLREEKKQKHKSLVGPQNAKNANAVTAQYNRRILQLTGQQLLIEDHIHKNEVNLSIIYHEMNRKSWKDKFNYKQKWKDQKDWNK